MASTTQRDRSGRVDPLTKNGGGSGGNLYDLDEKVYGEIHAADSSMQVVESIRLDDISPDPGQPRRIIPAAVRDAASGRDIPFLFDTWATKAFKETGGVEAPAPDAHRMYRAMIEGRLEADEWQLPEKPGHIEASILSVAGLATSIRQKGLLNPITIAPAPDWLDAEYIIETGERRYWAYRLLNFYYGEDWLKIPAKIQPKLSVWNQANENNQRDNLNSIGKARQLAILLMDLLQQEEFENAHKNDQAARRLFSPITGFLREQEFYAQVADGDQWRVPYGKIDLLLNAMGLKNRANLSHYRAMLKLPPEIWIEADDKNYSRDSLLQIVSAGNSLDPERPDYVGRTLQQNGGNISQPPATNVPTLAGKPAPIPTPNPSPLHGEGNKSTGQGTNIPKAVSHTDEGHVGASPEAGLGQFAVGKWVKIVGKDGDGNRLGIVTKRINSTTVEVEIDGRFHPYAITMLAPVEMEEGMAVMTRTRHVGWIVGGVGSGAVQVKANGAVTTHHPDTLKPVNRAPEKPAEQKSNIRRFDLVEHPQAAMMSTWIDRYKRVRNLTELMFIQTSYGHMALREDAKAAASVMQSTLPTAWKYENTEHGMAFFALEYRVIEEIAKQRPVATYVDAKDPSGINKFWVDHVLKQKPTAVNTTPAKVDDQPEPVPDVRPDQAMMGFAQLVDGKYTEDDLEMVRLFWIQKCHESGIQTPWDSDTAITGWLAENLVEGGEIPGGLTLEAVEAAQHMLAEARRWLEKRK